MACRRAMSAAFADCIIVNAASPATPAKIKRFILETSVTETAHEFVPAKYSELLSRLVRKRLTRLRVVSCIAEL
jgi:hypothetical protein